MSEAFWQFPARHGTPDAAREGAWYTSEREIYAKLQLEPAQCVYTYEHETTKRDRPRSLKMAIAFPDLPYAHDALSPAIGSETLQTHHGKHHKAYVDKTNAAIEGTDLADASLESIIAKADETGNAGVMVAARDVTDQLDGYRGYYVGLTADSGKSEDAAEPPMSPLDADAVEGDVETIQLVPFGSTRIRVTLFPWTKPE